MRLCQSPVGSKIASLANRLSKPTSGEAQVLGKLFPSSSRGKKRSKSFDPTNDCCVLDAQKKKKAADVQGRPTNVQVVMLQTFVTNLPRGRYRNDLKKDGRVQTLQFRRSMTALQTRNQILQGFRELSCLESWTVLETRDNHLIVAKNQLLDGDGVINRKGCLYLCQKANKVIISCW